MTRRPPLLLHPAGGGIRNILLLRVVQLLKGGGATAGTPSLLNPSPAPLNRREGLRLMLVSILALVSFSNGWSVFARFWLSYLLFVNLS